MAEPLIYIKRCTICGRYAADAEPWSRSCPHPADMNVVGTYMCPGRVQLGDYPEVEAAYRLIGAEALGWPCA